MRKITKNAPPQKLTKWQRNNPGYRYDNLPDDERRAIRTACLVEQKGLCAFCCCPVTIESGHNAHLHSRGHYPEEEFNWNNIVVSCNTHEQCGRFQGQKEIPLSPLMDECETEMQFSITGKVTGSTGRAQKTIQVLNLNNPSLCSKRKKALEYLLFSIEFYPIEDIPLWDEEIIHACIAECGKEEHGNLPPYSPVLVNILKQLLKTE